MPRKFDEKKKEERILPPPRKYSEAELRGFEQEIEKLRIVREVTFPEPGTVSVIRWDDVMVAMGAAVVRDGSIVMKLDEWGQPAYKEIENKWNQLNWLNGKKEYSLEKHDEWLDELAKQHEVPDTF